MRRLLALLCGRPFRPVLYVSPPRAALLIPSYWVARVTGYGRPQSR